MNTSSEEIKITIKVEENGFVIYDDTQSFIELVNKNDSDVVADIVAAIVRGRVNDGVQSPSLW